MQGSKFLELETASTLWRYWLSQSSTKPILKQRQPKKHNTKSWSGRTRKFLFVLQFFPYVLAQCSSWEVLSKLHTFSTCHLSLLLLLRLFAPPGLTEQVIIILTHGFRAFVYLYSWVCKSHQKTKSQYKAIWTWQVGSLNLKDFFHFFLLLLPTRPYRARPCHSKIE